MQDAVPDEVQVGVRRLKKHCPKGVRVKKRIQKKKGSKNQKKKSYDSSGLNDVSDLNGLHYSNGCFLEMVLTRRPGRAIFQHILKIQLVGWIQKKESRFDRFDGRDIWIFSTFQINDLEISESF